MRQQPTTETMPISAARQQLSQLVNRVFRQETRILIEKSGIPVAALISADDLDRLNRFDEERSARFKALEASQAAFADVPDDELARQVEAAIAAVRAERRAHLGSHEPIAKTA